MSTYVIRTDLKVSGSALTVDGLTTLEDLTINGGLILTDVGSAPTPTINQTPGDAVVTSGGDTAIYLSEPTQWITVQISGTDYLIPAYQV